MDRLIFALNADDEYYVELPDEHFVGVHVRGNPTLTILEQEGYWFYGKVNRDRTP